MGRILDDPPHAQTVTERRLEEPMAKKSTSTKTTKPKTAKAKPPSAQAKSTTLTLEETLRQLKALGSEEMRAYNAKSGVGDNQFGVKHGDIRVLAKKIKADYRLAMSSWETGNLDARYLAILLIKPKDLSTNEVDRLVRSVTYAPGVTFAWLADWLNNYVVKQHADKETLRQQWM